MAARPAPVDMDAMRHCRAQTCGGAGTGGARRPAGREAPSRAKRFVIRPTKDPCRAAWQIPVARPAPACGLPALQIDRAPWQMRHSGASSLLLGLGLYGFFPSRMHKNAYSAA